MLYCNFKKYQTTLSIFSKLTLSIHFSTHLVSDAF